MTSLQDGDQDGNSSRVQRARHFFTKMNSIFGSNYEQKMVVVSLLKQYAEDRDVTSFSQGIHGQMLTAQHRKLIPHIRPFVPASHRRHFDDALGYQHSLSSESIPRTGAASLRSSATSHLQDAAPPYSLAPSVGEVSAQLPVSSSVHSFPARSYDWSLTGKRPPRNHPPPGSAQERNIRTLTIFRDHGSFGFILKGHNPVQIESLTPGGPANRAGLMVGDAILKLNGLDVRDCTHTHLIKLLQGSGLSPTIEVMHGTYDIDASLLPPEYQSSPDSSTSSTQSFDSVDWLIDDSQQILDREGRNFKQRCVYLLTAKERMAMRTILIKYNTSRNILELVRDLTPLLDTPSKLGLWAFLLPRMSSNHRQFVHQKVDIPKQQLEDVLDSREPHTPSVQPTSPHHLQHQHQNDYFHKPSDDDSFVTDQSDTSIYLSGHDEGAVIGSFKQQLDHLLTIKERSQLKKALQIYAEKRNVYNLIDDLTTIMDTPSKRTLWFYIIPLLSPNHQSFCQRQLGLPEHVISKNDPSTSDILSSSNRVQPKPSHSYPHNQHHPGTRPHKTSTHPPQSSNKHTSRSRSTKPRHLTSRSLSSKSLEAVPKDGDILFHQEQRMTSRSASDAMAAAAQRANPHQNGMSSSSLHSTEIAARQRQYRNHQENSTVLSPEDGEQSTLIMNPIYVDINSGQTVTATRLKSAMKNRKQTAPVDDDSSDYMEVLGSSPRNQRQVPHGGYGGSEGYGPRLHADRGHTHTAHSASSITSHHRPSDPVHSGFSVGHPHISSGQINGHILPYTNGDVPEAVLGDSGLGPLTAIHHVTADRARVVEGAASQDRQQPTTSARPGTESDVSSVMKASVASFDSYQRKAMSAIQALDDVVANQQQRIPNYMSSTDDERGVDMDIRHRKVHYEADHGQRMHAEPTSVIGLDDNQTNSTLAYADNHHETPDSSDVLDAPPPPPAPSPPPAPAPPEAPPLPGNAGSQSMQVKRINWEKIDAPDSNTVWGKIKDGDDLADVVKYLELEQQFSTKKNKFYEAFNDRKNELHILAPKKAYNMSILLGHLRRPVSSIRSSLYNMDETVLTAELLKQMLVYAPDATEMTRYQAYQGPIEEMSKPDQFIFELSKVPGYERRLKAMLFKANFAEKVEELKQNINCIRACAEELRQSTKIAKILELVLAMGNYMNQGNQRVGEAAGFKISFLAQLELTKTSDNKSTFLHVLAETARARFPWALPLSKDLPSLTQAAKVMSSVSTEAINEEVQELRSFLQEITQTVEFLERQPVKDTDNINDRFHTVMQHFLSHASQEIRVLLQLQTLSQQEIEQMVIYFGETPSSVDTAQIFKVFAEFVHKFERAHLDNLTTHRRLPGQDDVTTPRQYHTR